MQSSPRSEMRSPRLRTPRSARSRGRQNGWSFKTETDGISHRFTCRLSFEYIVMSARTLCYDIWVVDLESRLLECFDVVEFGPFEVSRASGIHTHLDSVML